MTQQKFAVFDIDGTLIRWQLYHAVVDRLAKATVLEADARQIIHQARMNWKRRENPDSFHAYEKVLIDQFEQMLKRTTPANFDAVAREIIEEYQDQTYTYTRTLIQDLRQKGYLLLAISGSHSELVEKIAKRYGFNDFLATTYERKAGAFTGKKTVPGLDKKSALLSLIEKHHLSRTDSYAIGDSLSDASMLEIVENPIAFNPDQKLCQVAQANGWKIVIERKNVVYQLEKKDEAYILT